MAGTIARVVKTGAQVLTRRFDRVVSSSCGVHNVAVSKSAHNSSVDPVEVATFERLSQEWMDEDGPFKALHSYNRLRLPWIVNGLGKETMPGCLRDILVADLGCGGGLISVPLARLGAKVEGVDMSQQALRVAEISAKEVAPAAVNNLTFHNSSVEEFAKKNRGKFDAVVASEIIEHVNNLDSFLDGCVELCKPGSPIFLTTINRTVSSKLLAVWLAEDVFGLAPSGVHDWDKFIEPDRLTKMLEERNCRINMVEGVAYNPLTNKWSWTSCNHINYAVIATRV